MKIEHVAEVVGANIKRLRERQGLTQEELAKKTTLSRASIANIEAGRQKLGLEHIYDLANALKASITDFLPDVSTVDLERRVESKDLSDEVKSWIKDILSEVEK